jgi:hypothetical protein
VLLSLQVNKYLLDYYYYYYYYYYVFVAADGTADVAVVDD